MTKIIALNEIKKHDKVNTLLVIDIDNTLLHSESFYGSVEWCSSAIKRFGFIIGLSLWHQVLKNDNVKMSTVEDVDDVNSFFGGLSHCKVILCTKRSKYLMECTFDQLNQCIPQMRLFSPEYNGVKLLKHGYLKNGIIFCDLETKWGCLTQFISEYGKGISEIIVVDDTPFLNDSSKIGGIKTVFYKFVLKSILSFNPQDVAWNKKDDPKMLFLLNGKMGSGKGLFFEFVCKIFGKKNVGEIRFSESIKKLSSKFTLTTLADNYNNKAIVPKKFASIETIFVLTDEFVENCMGKKKDDHLSIALAFATCFKIMCEGMSSLGKCQVYIGMAFRELFSPDIWVMAAQKKIDQSKHPINVIVDARFKNEAKFFESKEAILFRLERDRPFRVDSFAGRDENHISETDLDDYSFQFTLFNNGTKMDLYDRMLYLFREKT